MGLICKVTILMSLMTFSLHCDESLSDEMQKKHVLYLLQSHKFSESIDLYQNLVKENNAHDFETLEGMAHILLQQASGSKDEDEQLLCIYAMSLCGISSLIHILESGIDSKNPLVQASTIQILSQLQEDFVDG